MDKDKPLVAVEGKPGPRVHPKVNPDYDIDKRPHVTSTLPPHSRGSALKNKNIVFSPIINLRNILINPYRLEP